MGAVKCTRKDYFPLMKSYSHEQISLIFERAFFTRNKWKKKSVRGSWKVQNSPINQPQNIKFRRISKGLPKIWVSEKSRKTGGKKRLFQRTEVNRLRESLFLPVHFLTPGNAWNWSTFCTQESVKKVFSLPTFTIGKSLILKKKYILGVIYWRMTVPQMQCKKITSSKEIGWLT